MEKRRMEEISLILLRHMLKRKGIHVSTDLKREAGNISKDTGIPQKELLEFGKILTLGLVEESFKA